MSKKIFVSLIVAVILLSGCGQKSNQIPDNKTSVKGDVGNDICAEFSADFVYSVIKQPITEVKPSLVGANQGCQYNIGTNNAFVAIYFENLSVANNKKGNEMLGRTMTTDPSIKMENYIVWREDKVNGVYLVINPNRFARIDRSSTKVITNEQNIELAARVADKLNGNLKMTIEKNPIDIAAAKEAALGASQEQVVRDFLDALSGKNIQKALGMMDANDNTKQSWGVNFNTIKSLEIKKIEEAFKEEWTPTRQTFKATLNVQVTDAGLQIGWENGTNFRWITVEKNASGWQVHELANNP